MMTLVTVSPEGHLRRYLCGDRKSYLTHEADVSTGFSEPMAVVVESFRSHPPEVFRVGALGYPWSPDHGGAAA